LLMLGKMQCASNRKSYNYLEEYTYHV